LVTSGDDEVGVGEPSRWRREPAGWRGIYPALCTPFDEDDRVDLGAQRRVARFVLDAGAHGLVLFGLAGEVLKLRADERLAIVEVVLEEVAGRIPVLVGAGAESATSARELARAFEAAGASGLVVPAPVTGASVESAILDYFARVASAVSIPVMIQDAPAYLGVTVGPRLVAEAVRLAENVRLVKVEAGPVEMSRWLDALGPGVGVWGGDGGVYLLDCVRSGASGIIPGADLVDLLVDVYETETGGDSERADELFRRVLPTLVFQMQHSIDHYNACAKRVLVRRGVLANPPLRPPAAPFPPRAEALLERHLTALGVDLRVVSR
jgi:4-hydroxy-tetrahydrodipicolinate synthase